MPGSGIGPASVSTFTQKYSKKWPHCLNVECISGDRSTFERKCLEHSDCTGFSFPAGQAAGGGCLKKCGPQEFGGFGEGSHGECDPHARSYQAARFFGSNASAEGVTRCDGEATAA